MRENVPGDGFAAIVADVDVDHVNFTAYVICSMSGADHPIFPIVQPRRRPALGLSGIAGHLGALTPRVAASDGARSALRARFAVLGCAEESEHD